jgi:ribosomal protein L12E/L44/L45/RPP1/RPP2
MAEEKKMGYPELSTLRRAAEGDLKVLSAYETLLDYDEKNHIPGVTESADIAMSKRYFKCYIQALHGINELLERHMKPFEDAHKKEQEAEKAKRDAENAERVKKQELKKKREEAKKNGISSLFDAPAAEPEEEIQNEEDYNDDEEGDCVC